MIETIVLDSIDIVSCSFGSLEELPSGADTPSQDIGGNSWGW